MHLKKELSDEPLLINRYIRRLIWFPIIQMLGITPFTIDVLVYYTDQKAYYWLSVIQIITDSITGIGLTFVYAMNPGVYDTAKECLYKTYCSLLCRGNYSDTPLSQERNSLNTVGVALANTRSRNNTSSSKNFSEKEYSFQEELL